MSDELWCARLGQVPYEEARALQDNLAEARAADSIPDVLLLLEHPPVYTKGRRSEPGELPMGEQWYEMQGIEVCATDRGGRVTYHGPGQLVGYPIVSLRSRGDDVEAYVRRLELVMIGVLERYGIGARAIAGLTGIWTDGDPPPGDPTRSLAEQREAPRAGAPGAAAARKIGSIGVHVRRGVTTHGFALNVNNDLQPFEWIVPCGIEGAQMTSICRQTGREVDMDEVMGRALAAFGEIHGQKPRELGAADLDKAVQGLALKG